MTDVTTTTTPVPPPPAPPTQGEESQQPPLPPPTQIDPPTDDHHHHHSPLNGAIGVGGAGDGQPPTPTSSRPRPMEKTKLFVGGLQATDTSLAPDEDKLIAYFSRWGTVASFAIIKDSQQKAKGYGFVTFDDVDAATTCLNYNAHAFDNKPIVVKPCKEKHEKGERRGGGGGGPPNGRINHSPSGGYYNRGYGGPVIRFPRGHMGPHMGHYMPHHHHHHHPHQAELGQHRHGGGMGYPPMHHQPHQQPHQHHHMYNQSQQIQHHSDNDKPTNATEMDLTKHFEKFGIVEHVSVAKDKNGGEGHKGFAFVTFVDKQSREKTLTQSEHKINQKSVKVEAKRPSVNRRGGNGEHPRHGGGNPHHRSGQGQFHSPRSPKYSQMMTPTGQNQRQMNQGVTNGQNSVNQHRSNSVDNNRENGLTPEQHPQRHNFQQFKNQQVPMTQLMNVNQYPMVAQQPVNNYPMYPAHSGTPQPMIYNPSSFNYSHMSPHNMHHPHQPHPSQFQHFVPNQQGQAAGAGQASGQQQHEQQQQQQGNNIYQTSYMIQHHPMMQPTMVVAHPQHVPTGQPPISQSPQSGQSGGYYLNQGVAFQTQQMMQQQYPHAHPQQQQQPGVQSVQSPQPPQPPPGGITHGKGGNQGASSPSESQSVQGRSPSNH